MNNIRVQFTIPNVDEMANLEVNINGEKRNMKFRIVNFDWNSETGSSEELIDVLRSRIQNYDHEWELYHIGTPHGGKIAVTFRHSEPLPA